MIAKQDVLRNLRNRQRHAVRNAITGKNSATKAEMYDALSAKGSISLDEINRILRDAELPEASREDIGPIIDGEAEA